MLLRLYSLLHLLLLSSMPLLKLLRLLRMLLLNLSLTSGISVLGGELLMFPVLLRL